ncbi:MAG: HAMP domain-containing sensor histidine kinase [Gillisia sp.]
MIYKKYAFSLFLRVLILFAFLAGLILAIQASSFYLIFFALLFGLISFYNLYRFIIRRFVEMDDFFEAVKYQDFSRWFVEDAGPQDIRRLHQGFNQVNKTIRKMNAGKEAQYVYLQKILEMVDVGIIAYNLDSGEVLWANEAIRKILNVPSFKNVRFLESRQPQLYETVFETTHFTPNSINIEVNKQKMKVLISDSVFNVENDSFKLIVLQNIDETLNQNEAEAWKKLLSVMTHEIMNSIAPISSLAETLQQHVRTSAEDQENFPLQLQDLEEGITSIKRRSEGLMKFAQTYRSLNKITHLNLEKVKISELFQSLGQLMQPSLKDKEVNLEFQLQDPSLQIEIDSYLIEQVLINLVLNSIDACKETPEPHIKITAFSSLDRTVQIKVSDNGKGIPEEIRETVFVPFFSTKKNGSGIGLSLCKQIMMLHQGKILLQSIEKEGTTISLIF